MYKRQAQEVVYVGDSVRLDMAPALALGMRACLIDRNDLFGGYAHRLGDLGDLTQRLQDGGL